MAERSAFLAALSKEERTSLERRLLDRQSGRCFICDDLIDLTLHEGQLDVDHIEPLAEKGPDEEHNFALTHASCNRSKGASDLRVARRMAEFGRLQAQAHKDGARGANLGHVLAKYGGGVASLRLKRNGERVEFTFAATGNPAIQSVPLWRDPLSGMEHFFTLLPLEYLHHDDRINPRSIGANVRALIEEFMRRRPQLHVSLAWWAPGADGAGPVKVFDGQHKAAAQILLGVKALPLRVFVEPDINVLLQTNTNAGGKLAQVAFDAAVMRHLGSTLFMERVRQYQEMKGLRENDYRFSEKDLVTFFRGEHREMLRYILDNWRDSITHHKENRLMEFVEWAGRGATRPLAYASVERTFFAEFLYMKALEGALDEGMEQGENPRTLERDQFVRLMSLLADIFFVGKWDPDRGGRQLEHRLQMGEAIPEAHLRAWRLAREEVLKVALEWVRLVIENYHAITGQPADKERLFHRALPEALWGRIEAFLQKFAALPCWIDRNLSNTVFGAKQQPAFWRKVFNDGVAPPGVRVLSQGLKLIDMVQ